jgi:translation initiation factor eIF-2B subunit delta
VVTAFLLHGGRVLLVRRSRKVGSYQGRWSGNGSAVNKAGSYLLASAARDLGFPFYVRCERFRGRSAGAPELEQMDPAELGGSEGPGIRVCNSYFDVTPARVIDGWFSERRLCRAWRCN